MENSKHSKLGNQVFLVNDNYTTETIIDPSTVDPRKSGDFPKIKESYMENISISNKPKR